MILNVPKVLWARFFYVSTPFLLVMAAAAAAAAAAAVVEPKICFDEAKNRAASSLWVGANRYRTDSCVSKLLWVYSHLKSDFFSEKNLLN